MTTGRMALVVGVDYYEHLPSLHGCVHDARAVAAKLERNYDGNKNFDVKLLTASSGRDAIRSADLKDQIQQLFGLATQDGIALFYFAGHGSADLTGGRLLASDSARPDQGVALNDVVKYARVSKATHRLVILDSCQSGATGSSTHDETVAEITEGTTILTASTASQYANEKLGKGVFTDLLLHALGGAAANLVGEITPGSVYAHIDRSLGLWAGQRPMFKTNVKTFVSLRTAEPPIPLAELRRITELFPEPEHVFPLDPTFEPEMIGRAPGMPFPNPTNTHKFATLQKFNRVHVVVPVDAPHMWHAAMGYKACRLTVLGEHYWRLVKDNRI